MPSNHEGDRSVSRPTSSGSRFLPRNFQPDAPKYHKEKRTISSSPLPSPAASPQQGRPSLVRWDSDSQDGSAQQREEANLHRLVVMARQQQSSMRAWLAASAGHYRSTTTSFAAPSPRPRSRSLPSSSGPVDVDSVRSSLGSRSVDGQDESTSRSLRMRFLLNWIRPETPAPSSTAAFETRSETTVSSGMETRRVSNVTDVERDIFVDDVGEKKCAPRLIGASLVCLFVLAVITVIVSLVASGDSSAPAAQTFGERYESSNSPSIAPSEQSSLTPSTFPTSPLTLEPTTAPSVAPSELPTGAPSEAPTLSPAPSGSPSQSPTSIFSTSLFKTLTTAKGTEQLESFGSSVSLSADGNIMAVGAPDYSHDGLARSGRVQIWERSNAGWQRKGGALVGRHSLDQFGHAVSLSSDGSRLAVSEIGFDGPAGEESGNVRVFDFDGDDWRMVGQEIGGEALANLSGLSLVLAGNGQRLAVGTPYRNNGDFDLAGRVHIFEWTTSSWQAVGDALDGTQSRDWFGWSIDLSNDGNWICVGAPRNTEHGGYVKCFRWTDGAWRQVGSDLVNKMDNVQPDDRFGMAVSLSEDGKVAIGAPLKDLNDRDRNSGQVVVYQLDEDGEDWTLLGDAFVGRNADDRFGWSLNLSGDYLSIGIPGLNQVSIHRWTDGLGWDTVSSPLQGDQEGDQFGFCVATSSNAKVVAVGATQKPNGGTGYGRVLERL